MIIFRLLGRAFRRVVAMVLFVWIRGRRVLIPGVALLAVPQKGLDDARQRGARYEDITMIGNYPLQDGRKYLFYVLSRRGFTGPEQLEQVYFVFTVARDGKITRIE